MIDVLLAAQLFIAASFVLAGFQDLKERMIDDRIWAPGIVGAVISLYWCYSNLPGQFFYIELFKLGMFSSIGIGFAVLGYVGEADAVALVLIGADPYLLSFAVLVIAMIIAGIHVMSVYRKGLLKTGLLIPVEQFESQNQWLPLAIVNNGQTIDISNNVNVSREDVIAKAPPSSQVMVQYGLPVVTYISLGYIAYLALSLVMSGGVLI